MKVISIEELAEKIKEVDRRLKEGQHSKLKYWFYRLYDGMPWHIWLAHTKHGTEFGAEISSSNVWKVWWYLGKDFYLHVKNTSLEDCVYAIYIQKYYVKAYKEYNGDAYNIPYEEPENQPDNDMPR